MNNPLEGLEGLPDAQKQELMTKIEEMQVRDRWASGPSCSTQQYHASMYAWRQCRRGWPIMMAADHVGLT